MAIIDGTNGVDLLTGTGSGDTINGLGGKDLLSGQGGNDTLNGGADDDVLIGGAGGDILAGGSGVDGASWSDSTQGVLVSLVTGTGSGGTAQGDKVYSIENLTGSGFADTLIGDAGANRLSGGNGDDVLRGGGGADTLVGGAGIDTASYAGSTAVGVSLGMPGIPFGDAAGDVLHSIENLSGSSAGDTLLGNDGVNTIWGGAGWDMLFGAGGADVLYGGADTDVLGGGAGADRLDGGAGHDVATYAESTEAIGIDLITDVNTGSDAVGDIYVGIEEFWGSELDDAIHGDIGDSVLRGNGGSDLLSGRDGTDVLHGGSGADTLLGGSGFDVLTGDGGQDTLTGGAGVDGYEYNFTSDSGKGAATRDIITDFSVADDTFWVAPLDAMESVAGDQAFTFIGTSAFSAEGQIRFTHTGGDTLVQFNTSGTGGADMEVFLQGIVNLTGNDFFL